MKKTQVRAAAASKRGFTLIELLTVIAIISILAALTFGALPRVRMMAKISAMKGNLKQMQTSLVTYMSAHGTYPPRYGYRSPETRGSTAQVDGNGDPVADADFYFLQPVSVLLGLYNAPDLEDNFSESYDTDRDQAIGLLEFSPLDMGGAVDTNVVSFPVQLYRLNNLPNQVGQMLEQPYRNFIYLPIYKRQFDQAKKYWLQRAAEIGTDANGTNAALQANIWEPNHELLRRMQFPPPSYDAFVLVGVGPGNNTHHILPAGTIGTENPIDVYHIAALRAAFMATRDLNQNGALDYHFEARTRGPEKGVGSYTVRVSGGGQFETNSQLPDPAQPNGQGPWIYVYGM